MTVTNKKPITKQNLTASLSTCYYSQL